MKKLLTLCCLLALAPAVIAAPPKSAPKAGGAQQSGPAIEGANEKPALSSSDEQSLFKWIAGKVAALRQPFCYRQSYGRGAGYPLTTCPAGQQKNGALCYPDCKAGYGGAGPVCWHTCPSGYVDTGAFCHVDKSLTAKGDWVCTKKKWGHCIWKKHECPSGYTNAGAFCALDKQHNPSGWKGDGLDLVKDSYGRGAGYPLHCSQGLEQDPALCYPACKDAYHGVGPVCWQNCPGDLTACGAGCANSTTSCVSSTANMIISPAMVVANIFSDGSAGKAEQGAQKGAQAAEEASRLKRMANELKELKAAYKEEIEMAKAAKKGASIGYKTGSAINVWLNDATGNFASITTPEVQRDMDQKFSGHPAAKKLVEQQYALQNLSLMMKSDFGDTASTALNIAAAVDPTGVAGVVAAYANPICANSDPMPNVRILY